MQLSFLIIVMLLINAWKIDKKLNNQGNTLEATQFFSLSSIDLEDQLEQVT